MKCGNVTLFFKNLKFARVYDLSYESENHNLLLSSLSACACCEVAKIVVNPKRGFILFGGFYSYSCFW